MNSEVLNILFPAKSPTTVENDCTRGTSVISTEISPINSTAPTSTEQVYLLAIKLFVMKIILNNLILLGT